MQPVDLKELLEAGVHFGHKTNRWNPKAAQFIYKAVDGTHIIDLAQTKERLERAKQYIFETAASGGVVLFVGTKRQAMQIVQEQAKAADAPYLSQRWVGGLVTNWDEVKKNIEKLIETERQLADKKEMQKYTKRERLLIERDVDKLKRVYGGVVALKQLPSVLFVVDTKKEEIAILEARQKNIPVVGVVDTNANPDVIDYPIPANDDALGSVTLITHHIATAYKEGREAYQKLVIQQENAKKIETKEKKK